MCIPRPNIYIHCKLQPKWGENTATLSHWLSFKWALAAFAAAGNQGLVFLTAFKWREFSILRIPFLIPSSLIFLFRSLKVILATEICLFFCLKNWSSKIEFELETTFKWFFFSPCNGNLSRFWEFLKKSILAVLILRADFRLTKRALSFPSDLSGVISGLHQHE